MAEPDTPDLNDYVLYLRQLSSMLEKASRDCQKVFSIQQETLRKVERLLTGPDVPQTKTQPMGPGGKPN